MTMTTQEMSKSRRAHSPCLAFPEREALFDTAEFIDRFNELNADLTVWDSIKGESA